MGFFSCCGRDSKWKEERSTAKWRIFSLKELHSATNNFNYDNKLGEGGFGSVYWGQLWDGSQIAVKRFKEWSNEAEREFTAEVEILGKVKHKNLLCLRGYCAEGQERLIVYDYMPNLSLHSHLHGSHSRDCLLDWKRRMSIAIGSAEGIAFLHHHATPHGRFSEMIDSRLNGEYVEGELKRLVLVGLVCAQNEPEKRPTMHEVLALLKGELKEKMTLIENEMFQAGSNEIEEDIKDLDENSDCSTEKSVEEVKETEEMEQTKI
ncbi:PTI1-like tyrosine-protein kinase [Carex littledalei]|uniref:non-specific serine/threonine protein kinase n=1 Tax=Carex littledalei TaxID=544730 RepID=A0A833RCX1_9POAL|nr:PTI1-like tyrosine-protein kinase [Carex littledalei]